MNLIFGASSNARVSTEDQACDGQCQRLSVAGCQQLFEEKPSGANPQSPKVEKLIEQLRKGAIPAVNRLDRLASSPSELLRIAERLTEKNAELHALYELWADTTSPSGRMVMTIFAGIAEFECTTHFELNNRRQAGCQGARRRLRSTKDNVPRTAAAGQGTRPKQEVDQRRCQDLRRPTGLNSKSGSIKVVGTFRVVASGTQVKAFKITQCSQGRPL